MYQWIILTYGILFLWAMYQEMKSKVVPPNIVEKYNDL